MKAFATTAWARYDDGEWLIQGETARIFTNADTLAGFGGMYLSLGYQFENITPYISLGYFDKLSAVQTIELLDQASKITAKEQPFLFGLISTVLKESYSISRIYRKSESVTLGLR